MTWIHVEHEWVETWYESIKSHHSYPIARKHENKYVITWTQVQLTIILSAPQIHSYTWKGEYITDIPQVQDSLLRFPENFRVVPFKFLK